MIRSEARFLNDMRATLICSSLCLLGILAAFTLHAQQPDRDDRGRVTGPVPLPKAAGSWSELMIDVVYPASNTLFYLYREPPTNDVEWNEVRMQAMMLAEAGNVLMMPGRRFDNDIWMRDARMMVDAGIAAYEAAKRKDVDAITALNDQIYNSCIVCHGDYRSFYGVRPLAGQEEQPSN